ncbi:MAG: MarR family transcriptional regulator [Gemmatimonadetes bacterium]|nr:MarR family transcriptional regulator [Gemmatimonadota bacterium]
MGTRARRTPNIAGALFTPVQQRVLGLLYGQPDRRFQSAELIRLAGSGTGAVHRQLRRLAQAGLVTTTALGNQRYYQANQASPVYHELHALIAKTVGIVQPIRRALEPHAHGIQAAFVYGSVASGSDRADSDIDLIVLSDALDHATVYAALDPAERALGRSINPTLVTRDEWDRKRAAVDSFAARVAAAPRVMILGSEDDIA